MSESITPDVERVLRALDERCAEAERKFDKLSIEATWSTSAMYAGKAGGVATVRSYIADALRGVL